MRPRELIVGAVQGPAELLPVSSSAHAQLLGATDKADQVAVHAGSALAALAARTRVRPWFAALTLLPPAALALAAQPRLERVGRRGMAAGLVAGSVALVAADGAGTAGRIGSLVADRAGRGRSAEEATAADALAIGAGQAAALWPGVSRSAATLAVARLRGFTPEAAWSLSREAWVPALLGATARLAPRLRPEHVPMTAVAAASTSMALHVLGPPRRLRAFAAYRSALAVWTVWEDRRDG